MALGIIKPLPVEDVTQTINNRTSFHAISTHQGHIVSVATTGVVAGTDFNVTHGLGYVPTYVELLVNESQSDAYLSVKPGSTAWTSSQVTLQCNTDNAALTIRIS